MSVISLDKWLKSQAKTSKSKKSQSKPNSKSEQTGQTHINFTPEFEIPDPEQVALRELYRTLSKAHRNPFLTKSRFARAKADLIAACASQGYITTRVNEHGFGNKWCITDFGIQTMYELEVYDHGGE